MIRASDREYPADDALRRVLKLEHGLAAEVASQASRAVFAYFRWRLWLEQSRTVHEQIQDALRLAERFCHAPRSFSDAELVARAAPAWVKTEMRVTGAWVRALQNEPNLWLRARRGQGRAVAAELGDCRVFGPGPLSDTLQYDGESDLFRTEGFHAGRFEVQDISSQAVGLICAARAGESWWDACAGEGGKTLQLSGMMMNKGLIWASDRAEWRLRRLKRRAARAGVFNYRAVLWNGGPGLPFRTKFDGVLVDAPCSGIGTWGRNPHARWTTNTQDVRELGERQESLLANAAGAVKPGGRLIYAVCTLARTETTGVVMRFESQFPEFEPLLFVNPLRAESAPVARTSFWPQDFGGNGMFIAAWRRRP